MTEKRGKKMKPGDRDTVQTPPITPNQAGKVAMHDLLGDKLRAYYDGVANEPVPDRFVQLLMELEAKSHQKKPD